MVLDILPVKAMVILYFSLLSLDEVRREQTV